jgi:hypothetical protein
LVDGVLSGRTLFLLMSFVKLQLWKFFFADEMVPSRLWEEPDNWRHLSLENPHGDPNDPIFVMRLRSDAPLCSDEIDASINNTRRSFAFFQRI